MEGTRSSAMSDDGLWAVKSQKIKLFIITLWELQILVFSVLFHYSKINKINELQIRRSKSTHSNIQVCKTKLLSSKYINLTPS
jgi:hypothetical protein